MQLPQVNLNGTSRDELATQYRNVYSAVDVALDLLCRFAPHGRDYQTLPAGSYDTARREHDARVEKLASIKAEIEAIAIHIQE